LITNFYQVTSFLVCSRLTWALLGLVVRAFTYWFPNELQAEILELFQICRDTFQGPNFFPWAEIGMMHERGERDLAT